MDKKIYSIKEKILLTFILMLSVFLNFTNLKIEGYGNIFYAAAVKSMMMSLKNFFFLSFDPGGFVSIDKPPLGFWIQTLFAKLFGFNGLSIILPQAFSGVISVVLIYCIVKKNFGFGAGLGAALCLSITPIFVAVSRNNTIDNLMLMFLLCACLTVQLAAESGSSSYFILSLVFVGVAFNVKMLEAYMVLPAIYLVYFFGSNINFKRRIRDFFLGTMILFTISLSWALVVDLVPTSNRPYVGSSINNSVIQLIVGHNGLDRIGIKSIYNNFDFLDPNKLKTQVNPIQNYVKSDCSIFRLFQNNNMTDQISWLLLFAIISLGSILFGKRLKIPFDGYKKTGITLWGTWFLTEFIYFSFSKNITHTYYLTTMAPSIAALTGIGVTTMWNCYKEKGIKSYLLPVSLIANGYVEINILSYNYKISKGYGIVMLVVAVLCILCSLILILVKALKNIRGNNSFHIDRVLVGIAFAGILAAPIVWSFTPVFYKMNGNSPSAGLELVVQNIKTETNLYIDSNIIKFLEKNYITEKYLVAVSSANSYGSALVLETGKPVMTIGGFSGSDPILTLNGFKRLIREGQVRYAFIYEDAYSKVINSSENGSNTDIINWIKENGNKVPDSEWGRSNLKQRKNVFKTERYSSGFVLYDFKLLMK